MNFVHLFLTLTIAFSETFARYPRKARPNVMGALQNVLAPGYNERPQIYLPNQPLAFEEMNMPNVRVVQPKYPYQQEIIYSKTPEIIPQFIPNMSFVPSVQAPVAPVIPVPAPLPAQLPALMPAQLPALLPTTMPAQSQAQLSAPLPAQIAPVTQAIPEAVYPIVQEKYNCNCPCSASAPAPLVSPFLPSASPVSPWAPPTSNLLPPVQPNQSRSHFLRKIPIPPPTL